MARIRIAGILLSGAFLVAAILLLRGAVTTDSDLVRPGGAQSRSADVARDDPGLARTAADAPGGSLPPSSGGPSPFLVRTVDAARVPVSGVEVHWEGDDSWGFIGRTDTSGGIRADLPPAARRLLVRSESWCAPPYDLEPHPSEATIILREAGRIAGTVVYAGGGLPVGEGVGVTASPVGRSWVGDEFAHQFSGSPSAKTATTDAQGRFGLAGLDPRVAYRLNAGGNGLMRFDNYNIPSHPTGSMDVTIEVGSLHAAVVRLVDENGNRPRFNPELAIREGSAIDGRFLPLCDYNPAFLQAWDYRPDPADPFVLHWFIVMETAEPLAAPASLRMSIPGYERVDEEIWLHPVSREEDVFQTVTVRPTAAAFGSVRFLVRGKAPASHLDFRGRNRFLGEIVFRPTDSSPGFSHFLEAAEEEQQIDAIPAGAYRIDFIAEFDAFAPKQSAGTRPIQELAVVVTEDDVCEVPIDLTACGSLLLRFPEPRSDELSGDPALNFMLRDTIGLRRAHRDRIRGGFPFLVEGVFAGDYELWVRRGMEDIAGPLSVAVYAGGVTLCDLDGRSGQ